MNPTDRELTNLDALMNPQPGDYWHEMFCPYFIIVNIEGEQYRVLSCLGGPNSFNRKNELNAKINVDNDNWAFDYSKSILVNHSWLEKTVTYGNVDGFVADVVRSEKTQRIVQEWRNWKQKDLRNQIQSLESEWEKFTGWKYLKEEIQ